MRFFDNYFKYVGASEAPAIYHRWSAISMLGALLCRSTWLPFGHGKIYPNQYLMLMGSPGTRKGTAIGIAENLLRDLGYTRFAPDRLSKERFLIELKPRDLDTLDADLESLVIDSPAEIYVIADEFADFVGQGGMEFMTMLTKLWDNKQRYEHPKIHGKSIIIDRPTVNILAGNTAQGLALSIPTEALGNGFMSRIIFIHSEPTGRKITFPMAIGDHANETLLTQLREIDENVKGPMDISEEARVILDRMYKEYGGVDDPRFKHYGTRRFTHLLKLCIILAASDIRLEITAEDALNANTLLYYTELRMPKALGEYGKSKYSDVSHDILESLSSAVKPLTMNEIFKLVSKDLSKVTELADILKNLLAAEKIQIVNVRGKQGYMTRVNETKRWDPSLLNESFLTEEELF
jgi:hypothetical protein